MRDLDFLDGPLQLFVGLFIMVGLLILFCSSDNAARDLKNTKRAIHEIQRSYTTIHEQCEQGKLYLVYTDRLGNVVRRERKKDRDGYTTRC